MSEFKLENKGILLMMMGIIIGFLIFSTEVSEGIRWMALIFVIFGIIINFMIPEKTYKKNKKEKKEIKK